MAIKKSTNFSLLIGILTILGTASLFSTVSKGNYPDISNGNDPNLNAALRVLVDKVYNFTIDRPYLSFEKNLYFAHFYTYFITVCIVTPHTCNLNITLWDPDGDEYQISYEEFMVQDDYREVPFGVAISGNYSMLFSAELTQNLNIHLNIERGGLCLYDKILTEELSYIIYYNVLKFYNDTHVSHPLTLKTDMDYRFYFGRVSAISKNLSGRTELVHTITDDSQSIPFIIYANDSVASPKEVTSYHFGTAGAGQYTVNLTIYCDVPAVNIAYAIVEKHRIADGTDPNDDDPPPPPDDPINGTGIEAFIPREWTIGMIAFVGSAVAVPIIIVVYRKRKNPTGL